MHLEDWYDPINSFNYRCTLLNVINDLTKGAGDRLFYRDAL